MPFKDPEARREYQRRWRQERHDAWFADKVCANCGATENLELHHLDKETKVDHRIWSWAEDRRLEEIAKCIVLCDPCHNATHRHGTPEMYATGCRCESCTTMNWLAGFNSRKQEENPASAFCRENGGGGTRTRVSGNPDAPDLQGERESVPGDPARPSLCNSSPRPSRLSPVAQNGRLAKLARRSGGRRDAGRGCPLGSNVFTFDPGPIGFDIQVRQQCSSGSRPIALAQPGNRKCERDGSFRVGSHLPGPLGRGVELRPGARVASTNTRDGAELAAPTQLHPRTAVVTRAGKDGALVEGTCPRKAGRRRSFTAWLDAGSIPAGSITLSSCTTASVNTAGAASQSEQEVRNQVSRRMRGARWRARSVGPRSVSSFRNQRITVGLVRRGGVVRAQRVALHLAPAETRHEAGVRALGARLLEDLQVAVRAWVERRGCVERNVGSSLRRRDVVHVGHLEHRRLTLAGSGASGVVDVRDRQAAGAGADPRGLVHRVGARQLARLAADIASVRSPLTTRAPW